MKQLRALSTEPRTSPGWPGLGFTDVVPIGRGASSEVFRAREPRMNRPVTIKVCAGPDGFAWVEREVAVAGFVGPHPHLVTVHGRGTAPNGAPYLVMAWYGGGSLAQYVRRRGLLDVAAVLAIGVKVAGALAHLHAQGVVHRDVKPANILLTDAGEPMLADLGLATLPGEPRSPAAALTPVHAAPEVLRGEVSTPRSDVWSLASTLCAVLDRSDIPAEVMRPMIAATSASQEDRPASGEAFAAQLQAVQAGLGFPVTEVPRPASPPVGLPATGLPGQEAAALSPPTGDDTVLRAQPPVLRRNPWPAVIAGALGGTALALTALTVVPIPGL